MNKKIVEKIVRYILMIPLMLNFLDSVFVSYINPESYFFGEKLVGFAAIVYLLTILRIFFY